MSGDQDAVPPALEPFLLAEQWHCTPQQVREADELDVALQKLLTRVQQRVAWARANGGV